MVIDICWFRYRMCNKKCQLILITIMKRFIYILCLFAGLSVSLLLFIAENSIAGTIALIAYLLIYKPLCDMIYLHHRYDYQLKDMLRKYPFWSYTMMKKLYFE